jgi:hypothetical protein
MDENERRQRGLDKAGLTMLFLLLWAGVPIVLTYLIVGTGATEAQYEAVSIPLLVASFPIALVGVLLMARRIEKRRSDRSD